jgi:hypothetical protein
MQIHNCDASVFLLAGKKKKDSYHLCESSGRNLYIFEIIGAKKFSIAIDIIYIFLGGIHTLASKASQYKADCEQQDCTGIFCLDR